MIRDLRKRRKNPMLLFPIIFTSSIGLIKNDGMVGKVNNNGISQTPQAFLDCQVMDSLLMAQIAGRVKEIIEQTKTSVTFDRGMFVRWWQNGA